MKKTFLILIISIVSICIFSNNIKVIAETTESTDDKYNKTSYLYLDIIDSKYFDAETCKNDTACPFKIESDGSYKIISTFNNPYNIDDDGITLEARTQWSSNYVKLFLEKYNNSTKTTSYLLYGTTYYKGTTWENGKEVDNDTNKLDMTKEEFYNSVSILWIEDNRGIVWNATPIRGDELEIEGNYPNITLTRVIPKEVIENINASSTERKIYIPNIVSIYEKSNSTKGEATIDFIDLSRGHMKVPNKDSEILTGNIGEKINYSCPTYINIDFKESGTTTYVLDKTRDYVFNSTFTKSKKSYKCYYNIAEEGYIPEEDVEYNVTFDVGTGKLLYNDTEQTKKTFSLSEITFSQYTAIKDNNKFIGWATYDNKDICDNSKLKTSSTLKVTEDITYYACYINNSTNDDNSNGGNQSSNNNNEQPTNPPTGSFPLYIIYLLGITALCYTFYLIYKLKKAKNI